MKCVGSDVQAVSTKPPAPHGLPGDRMAVSQSASVPCFAIFNFDIHDVNQVNKSYEQVINSRVTLPSHLPSADNHVRHWSEPSAASFLTRRPHLEYADRNPKLEEYLKPT
ncbi:hypothetical protein E2C01_009698 [Portunus trituberculatus]|uniref:Uncharacterized protein n=1 Tax=Portunus trituberculatus TaxID=210409 RepID=A0A5B7D6F7_PORTR|nr:hypothetical protein [Portunus trituberculatus]